MCGIAGFTGAPKPALLAEMCNSLMHRGPDEGGQHETEDVSLSMRRLAIIDLATGQQPIFNETRDIWVVFNGEIYNYESLMQSLKEAGHQFRTNSDTETIVHAYEEYGLDFVEHLQGMYGIALWDDRLKRLVLVRDRIGEKPLFYSEEAGELYFASEIKAIFKATNKRPVNHQAVCDFFAAGYVTQPKTFYDNIRKLGPGQMAIYQDSRLTVREYWKHDPASRYTGSFDDAVDELDNKLMDTMRLCLKSDVEVGAFLSGGVDSSLIVAQMKRLSAEIQTFSVGYGSEALGFNELKHAKVVSDHVGTRHHELILDASSNIRMLPKIIWHYDEPHGEPTSMLVYLLCQYVQKSVKVALSGTGGDEIFFGYPRHAGLHYLRRYQRVPKFIRTQIIERIAESLPESTRGGNFIKRVKRFVSGAAKPPEEAYLTWVKLLSPELQDQMVAEDIRRSVDDPAGDEFLRRILLSKERSGLMDRICELDVGGYLPEYQLGYMDRMSMANSLEVRAPLCDYKLVNYATSLPAEMRLKGTRSKHIFKEVAKRYLPESIVERKKVGFDSPIGQWLKGELKGFSESFLARNQIEKSGLLNPDAVGQMLSEHQSGQRNYALQLWSVIAMEAWYRMYIEDDLTSLDGYSISDIRGVPSGVELV